MNQGLKPPTRHRLLRRGAVEDMTGLSRSTLYHLISVGMFPRPVKLSARAVAWRESDIEAWIEARETNSA